MTAGKPHDLKMFGMYAMDSMRLEKGYLAWKSEINLHHTPLETPISWTVKMDKDFIGKAGLEKQKADGAPRSWFAWCARPRMPTRGATIPFSAETASWG
jgi:dimethylglycine dehydrogenase